MDMTEARIAILVQHPDWTDQAVDNLAKRILNTQTIAKAEAQMRAAFAREELAEAKAAEARAKTGAPSFGDVLESMK